MRALINEWTAKDCIRDTVINLSAMRALINEWTAKDCISDTVINVSAMRALINRLHQGYSYQPISYESTDQWAAKDCSYPKTDKTSPLNTIIKIIVKCTNNFQFSIFI